MGSGCGSCYPQGKSGPWAQPCLHQRSRLQVWTEKHHPHLNSPLDLTSALKLEEQRSRTPMGKGLRYLTFTNDYSNVFACVDLDRKSVSSVWVCMGACACVVEVFQNHTTQNINSIAYSLLRCNKKRLSCYTLENRKGSCLLWKRL